MDAIHKHLSQVSEGMSLLDQGEIWKAVEILKLVRGNKGTVYLCGNGGSAATASHFANDLMKMAKIKAVCLNDAIPIATAYGNDDGWQNMFQSQLMNYMGHPRSGFDGVIGISCSGESENVVRALSWAEGTQTSLTIGMTGMSDRSAINTLGLGTLIHARVPDIRVQEDLHMMTCHAIVRALQENL